MPPLFGRQNPADWVGGSCRFWAPLRSVRQCEGDGTALQKLRPPCPVISTTLKTHKRCSPSTPQHPTPDGAPMKMRSPCKRLLLLLAAFSALAAHVAADCRGTAACPQSSGCSNPPPFPAAGPFPGSAYRHSCLANASLPCSSPANANCCSCGIYNRYCATASPGLNFVTNGNNLTTDNHALVLPRTPCAGVESWTHKSCGREGIWDAAVDLMLARDGTYGAAVNSVGRRGAHQLHVHVGKVWTTLTSALPKQPGTTMQLSCSKTPNRNLNCKRGTSLDYQLTATVVTADKPRHANAFKAAYGAPPSSSAITTTLLVVPLDLNNYALVTTTDVPAECLLHGQDFVCY